jgi:hypothetical protein
MKMPIQNHTTKAPKHFLKAQCLPKTSATHLFGRIAQPHLDHLLKVALPHDLHVVPAVPGHAHRDALLALLEARPSLSHEVLHRHANATAVLNLRLVLLVVQLGAHGRRQDLHDAHIRGAQLLAHRHDQVVQRRLAGAVVATAHDGHERQPGRREHQRRRRLVAEQVRQEVLAQVDVRRVVGRDLCLYRVQLDGLGPAEVEPALDARVQNHRVQRWEVLDYPVLPVSPAPLYVFAEYRVTGMILFGKAGDAFEVRDIELHRGDLVLAMFLHESIEVLTSPANGNDKGTRFDDLIGEGFTNPGSGAEDEDGFVGVRHID